MTYKKQETFYSIIFINQWIALNSVKVIFDDSFTTIEKKLHFELNQAI